MSTHLRPQLVAKPEAEIEQAFDHLPQIAPGIYTAYCRSARKYRDPGYKRWTCLLRFDVLSPSGEHVATLPIWFNLGEGDNPQATRRGRYLRAWVEANGAPPTRNDRLSPRVFTRRMARVEVADNKSPVPYSVVRRILSWETGGAASQEVNYHPSRKARDNGMMGHKLQQRDVRKKRYD